MQITDITQTKKGRFSLIVDGEFKFSVDDVTLTEKHISVGKTVTEAELEEIKEASDLRRAKEKAFSLLNYRDHSKKELFDKIKRTSSEEAAEAALDRMEELGYIDDESYALRLASDMFNLKLYGPIKVRYELSKRGIADEYIEQALINAPDMRENIRRLLNGKLKKYIGDRKKINAKLYALGYYYDDIRICIEEFSETEEKYYE